jgi:phenylacetate-CoA ligase
VRRGARTATQKCRSAGTIQASNRRACPDLQKGAPLFKTMLAQLRFAASIGAARPFAKWSLDQLIDSIIETRLEFGTIGSEGAALLSGPVLDDETRREFHLRRFRTQAVRGARETVYYKDLFERLNLDPAQLNFEDILRIPPTSKEALRENPDAFVRRTATPCFRTTTTGTTGKPTSICFSTYEMQTYIALAAIANLMIGRIDASDIVQISTSSRATLGNTCFAGACSRTGALVYLTGLIEPARTLALLAEKHHIPGKKPQVSHMSTYPSYLGELVEHGLQQGYHPSDFGLERIAVGGELVSEGLIERAQRLFGAVEFDEEYGMTETWPFSGLRCSGSHLHFEPTVGMMEMIDPETSAPASQNEAGSIVVTPLPPYRDTTILLRYDTEDLVRSIEGPLACELQHLPATSPLLGKRRMAVHHEGGWTFPRDVLEALETCDEVRLPARYGFWAAPRGVAVEVVARGDAPSIRHAIERRLEERGVPIRELHLVENRTALQRPVPLRCDLKEVLFDMPSAHQVPLASAGRSETRKDRR